MTTTNCPTDAELTDFHLGNLPPDRLEAVTSHVEACARCERWLEELDGVTDDALLAVRAMPGRTEYLTNQANQSALRSNVSPPLTGTRVGDYEVLEEIGRGGMGAVYKARHARLRRTVALKVLSRGEFAGAEDRQRFLAEAEAIARLRHPNIVQIHEVGEWQSAGGATLPFLALEYVEGGNLTRHTGNRPQPASLAAAWVTTLARAVQHAHDHGVIHRDLKPSNVLLTGDGQLKLCDFGVAKLFAGPDLQTRTGLLIGTPEYMAPEQAGSAQHVGPAADVWALGAILYSLLTGHPPFTAPDSLGVVRMLQEDDPLPPRQLQPAVSRDLETICLKCLHKDPASRYETAGQLADDLARFQQGVSVLARPTGVAERSWKWVRRRPGRASALISLLLLLLVGLPGTTYLWLRAEGARRQASEALARADNSLYFNNVALAHQGLGQGDVAQARSMLERCLPAPGGPDRRGWEWHYLQAQANLGRRAGMRHEFGEWGWIYEVAWSPDGRRLASVGGPVAGTNPGELKLWDVASGRCQATLPMSGGAVWTVAWHPNGRTLVTGDRAHRVLEWDVTRNPPVARELWRGQQPGGTINRLRFSPDGRFLAIGGSHTFRLRDYATQTDVLVDDRWGCETLAFSASGGSKVRLIAARFNRSTPVRMWDISDSGPPVEVRHAIPPGAYSYMAFGEGTSSGCLPIAEGWVGDVEIWDADGKRIQRYLHGHRSRVLSLAFAKGGPLATASEGGAVQLWNPVTAKPGYLYSGHVTGVLSVAFDPDGARLASAGKDGDICVYDATRDPRGLTFFATGKGWGDHLTGMVFAADGRSIVVVSQLEQQVFRYDVATGKRLSACKIPLLQAVQIPRRDQALRPGGRQLAALAPERPEVLKIWNVEDGTEAGTLGGHEGKPLAVAWSADARSLASCCLASGTESVLRLWDPQAMREVRRWRVEGACATAVGLNHNGSLLAAALVEPNSDPNDPACPAVIRVWETATGRQRFALKGAAGGVLSLVFRPDGGQLAAAGHQSNRVDTWDLDNTGKFLSRPSVTSPTHIAYSPDGLRLAAACGDNRVRVWDTRSEQEAIALSSMGIPGSGNYGFSGWVAFSPDGRCVVATDWRATVNVWSVGEP